MVEKATVTELGRPSGGVAILARSHLPMSGVGSSPFDDLSVEDRAQYDGRFVAAVVGAGPSRHTLVVATYLWASEGLSQRNLRMLSLIDKWLCSQNRPFVWAGDFNNLPEDVAAAGVLNGSRSVVCPLTTPTLRFADRVMDYFIVSDDLSWAIQTCATVDGPTTPHVPVKLTTGKVGEGKGWTLKKPHKIDANPPIGPVIYPEVDWGKIAHKACSASGAHGLKRAHRDWCEGIQAELSARFFLEPADTDGRGRAGETKWETIKIPKMQGVGQGADRTCSLAHGYG